MIRIGKPYIEHKDGEVYLKADIQFGDDKEILWYRTKEEYGEYFCHECCDAFVVGLLYRAMITESDIICDAPVSEQLYYQLSFYLIDAVQKNNGKKGIKIIADTISGAISNPFAVGTGISGGIDTFYTIMQHSQENCPDRYKITHLAFFNIRIKEEKEIFQYGQERAKKFCEEYGYKFVVVDSNLRELVPYNHYYLHTYLNTSAVLSLQKLFAVYYYSSTGFPLSLFKIDLHGSNGKYDLLLLPMLSTVNTRFYSSGCTSTRLEKTMQLADFEPSYTHLMTCDKTITDCNCGACQKCARTLITFDILGVLDRYEKVYDLKQYYANKKKLLGYMLAVRKSSYYYKEIYEYAKENNYCIPFASRLYMLVYKINFIMPVGVKRILGQSNFAKHRLSLTKR